MDLRPNETVILEIEIVVSINPLLALMTQQHRDVDGVWFANEYPNRYVVYSEAELLPPGRTGLKVNLSWFARFPD